ncbi:hypothetical protein [Nostoc sp. ChiVER01]|uniref:hypothetical protein n=1 Tax=Nostoc sp. ChiVER01 TaxID=3075382 RepID=UPI002AD43398|nr:hypothetical protein [Nostoc sp. ChiVER01]MDZ8227659.1 hypothetical protein [Nostoc sp. ChiVER01]
MLSRALPRHWYLFKIAASADGISTIQVLCLPLVVDLRKVIASDLISVVWSASASDTRQPVNTQIPNRARWRKHPP